MASQEGSKESSPRSPGGDALQGPFNWQKRLRPTGVYHSKSSDLDKDEEPECSTDKQLEELHERYILLYLYFIGILFLYFKSKRRIHMYLYVVYLPYVIFNLYQS